MKILVFSDSHGDVTSMLEIVKKHPEAEEIIHLGDNVRDARRLADKVKIPVTFVRGNCDFADGEEKLVIVRGGVRIFLTHGNEYGMGYSLLGLSLAAQEENASCALFGHTHRSLIEFNNGVMLVNPGSISKPRGCAASYAMLDITDGFANPEIMLRQDFAQK